MTKKPKTLYPLCASASKGFLRKILLTDRYGLLRVRNLLKTLPEKVDLRDTGLYGEVRDQGDLESSVGMSLVSGCLEYAAKKDLGLKQALSVVYVYRKDRKSLFADPKKTVTSLMDAVEVLIYFGCCPDFFDEYGYKTFLNIESPDLDTLAQTFRLRKAYRLSRIKEIKACLDEGYPVATLCRVYPSLFDVFVYRTGEMPVPGKEEKPMGQHAMTIVGYDESKGCFIVRNSWSKSWGDLGYGYLPYEAFQKMQIESYSLRL